MDALVLLDTIDTSELSNDVPTGQQLSLRI